jgi:hypothetical protein
MYHSRILSPSPKLLNRGEIIDLSDTFGTGCEYTPVAGVHNEQLALLVSLEGEPLYELYGYTADHPEFRKQLYQLMVELDGTKPDRAREWLLDYFPSVRSIYLFVHHEASFDEPYIDDLLSIKSFIWSVAQGIMQNDGEGYTNTDGYHILWQFDDGVQGEWEMAVLTEAGKWVNFEMKLSDPKARAAFLRGEVYKAKTK